MGNDWKIVPVSEVCDSIVDCVNKTAPIVEHPTPFRMIRTTNVKSGHLNLDGARYVTEETFRTWTRRAVPSRGDVILTREAPLGEVAIIRDEKRVFLGQRLVQYRANRQALEPGFLFYAFLSPFMQAQIHAFGGTGSTVDHICVPDCAKFKIPVPPLAVQRAIAHILGTLDDKIELNRRTNETLEAMARALFKSWFVDFDPVHAKAEGRQPSGMDAETARLFPSEFVESELGRIPRGWRVGTLADLASLNPEAWSKATRPFEICYVDLSNTKWGQIEAVSKFSREGAPSRAQRVLRPGDTIVGTVRPGNGSYALVAEEGLTGSTGFAVLRPRQPENTEFVYVSATAPTNIEALSRLADGGAYPAVHPEIISATQIVNASAALLEVFSRTTRPLFALVAANERQLHSLANLRDALLPALLSGDLSASGAERVLEAQA